MGRMTKVDERVGQWEGSGLEIELDDDASLFSDVVTIQQKKERVAQTANLDIPNDDSFIDSAIGK